MESIITIIALGVNGAVLVLVVFFMYLILGELRKMNNETEKAIAIDSAVETIKKNNIGPLVRDIVKLITAIAVLLGILFSAKQ